MRGLLTATVGLLLLTGGCSFDLSASWPDAGPDGGPDAALDAVADAPLPDASPPGTTRWLLTCGAQAPGADAGPDAGPAYAMSGNSVAVDQAGNVYVAGSYFGPSTPAPCGGKALTSFGGHDVFLVKLDPQGKVIWALTGGSKNKDEATGVAVSPDGKTIIVVGYFSGEADFSNGDKITSKGNTDGFIIRLKTDSNSSWVRGVGGKSDDKLKDVALTGNGEVVVTGWFRSPTATIYNKTGAGTNTVTNTKVSGGTADILVGKLKTDGAPLWLSGIGGTENDLAEGIAVTAAGESYVSGFFNSADLKVGSSPAPLKHNGLNDALVLHVNADGAPQRGMSMGGALAEEAHGIAVAGGKPVVTGWYRSMSAPFGTTNKLLGYSTDDDLFVARLSAAADQVTHAQSARDTTRKTNEDGFDVAVLPDQSFIVAGASAGEFVFGATKVLLGSKIFIGRLSSKLDPIDNVTAAVSGGRAWSVAVVPDTGELVAAGFFSGTGTFGKHKISARGKHDLFVWKLTPP